MEYQRKRGRNIFSRWREFELDVILVREKDDDSIDLDLKLYGWVNLAKGDVVVLFGESWDSQSRNPSTKDVDIKLEDSFGYNRENIQRAEIRGGLQVRYICRSRWFFYFVLQNRGGRFITECSVDRHLMFERFWLFSYGFSERWRRWGEWRRTYVRWMWAMNRSRGDERSDSWSYWYWWQRQSLNSYRSFFLIFRGGKDFFRTAWCLCSGAVSLSFENNS